MADYEVIQNLHLTAGRLFYIHNCVLDVFETFESWFTSIYFDDFRYVVHGTYDKAVEVFKKEIQEGNTMNKPVLPAININGVDDNFEVDPKFAQIWRSGQIGRNQAVYMSMPPIYEDEYFAFDIIRGRFLGTCEMNIWVDSYAEYLNHRMMMLMFFNGGFNRRIRPTLVNTNVILDADLIEAAYQDAPYDFSESDLATGMVHVINGNYYLYPVELGPQIWLTGLNNNSSIYGGDGIAEYKLGVTFQYEVDLPTYFILRHSLLLDEISIKLSTGDRVDVPEKIILDEQKKNIYIPKFPGEEYPDGGGPPKSYFGGPTYTIPTYAPYMYIPTGFNRIDPDSDEEYKFKRTLAYKFETTGTDIAIPLDGETIPDFWYIIVGDGDSELAYDVDYVVNDTKDGIICKLDITAEMVADNYTWNIFIYNKIAG